MIEADHILSAFEALYDLGVEPTARFLTDTGRAASAVQYVRLLNAVGATPADLSAAVDAYVMRRLDHGGRRPWPDAGHLADEVRRIQVERIPPFGEVEKGARMTINRHFAFPAMGWDVTTVPEPAREILTRALVGARVAHRGGEDPTYVVRDLAAEYERLRKGGGAK